MYIESNAYGPSRHTQYIQVQTTIDIVIKQCGMHTETNRECFPGNGGKLELTYDKREGQRLQDMELA